MIHCDGGHTEKNGTFAMCTSLRIQFVSAFFFSDNVTANGFTAIQEQAAQPDRIAQGK